MNLIETFNLLEAPECSNRRLFNAVTLPNFPFAKIATNYEAFPALLISSMADISSVSQKNIRLKYLELTHNLECKVSENSKSKLQNFTVIIFRSDQSDLQQYFLSIAEILIKSLSTSPTQQEVFHAFKNFVEVFRSLAEPPSKTVQGLWAELFIIDSAKDPGTVLNYWHNLPEERFDFNADAEKLEVKSSSSLERKHIFTSEQLNPADNKQVLVASVYVKQSIHGQNISMLTDSICQKISNNDLLEKLFILISKTLGSTIENSIKVKFDYEIARNSLRYYKHQDIDKIEEINIPRRVSEVRYKSDLSLVPECEISNLASRTPLFKSL